VATPKSDSGVDLAVLLAQSATCGIAPPTPHVNITASPGGHIKWKYLTPLTLLHQPQIFILLAYFNLYSYQCLKSPRSFRVLTLLPGLDDSPLRCGLVESSLDDSPEYRALPYVWGSWATTKVVYIGNCYLRITESLHYALLNIRPPAGERKV
jgi:hypothetical protein